MKLFSCDHIDSELLKHLFESKGVRDPIDAVNVGHVLTACADHPTMQLVMKRQVPSLRVKSREWVIKVQLEAGKITNFAATRPGHLEAVWARPKDHQYIVGASSNTAFQDFIDKHYDVLVYYYASLDAETRRNITYVAT